jgi:hypothetical protein
VRGRSRSRDAPTIPAYAPHVQVRVRAGRGFGTYTSDLDETPVSAAAGDEIVVSEEVAAFLVRDRTVDVVEIIESGDGDERP